VAKDQPATGGVLCLCRQIWVPSAGGTSHKEAPSEAPSTAELRKSFTLALKIPLITTEEWRAASAAGLRKIGKRIHALEADAMTQLAIEKARALFP